MKIKVALGATVLVAIAGYAVTAKYFGVIRPWEAPRLLANMRAKEFCSCYFMLKNDREYCLKLVGKGYPLGRYQIEEERQAAIFSNYLAKGEAELVNSKLGCVLK